MIGRIAGLTSNVKPDPTPIAREISHFVKVITFVAVILGVIGVVAALAIGKSLHSFIVYVHVIASVRTYFT